MSEVQLFDDQQAIVDHIHHFFTASGKRASRLRANAGTGKTTVLGEAVKVLEADGFRACVVAPTGRAASQLRLRGIQASTFHSVMYRPELDKEGNLLDWVKKSNDEIASEIDGFICDEGSMIQRRIYQDLMSIGKPVFIAGDHNQLPPVDPTDDSGFNLMELLPSEFDGGDVTLTVNRRTDESAIGIYTVINTLLEEDRIPRVKQNGLEYSPRSKVFDTGFHREREFDVVLCGTNKTRKRLNDIIRASRGFREPTPEVGEKVICLSNSVFGNTPISNGELFNITGILDLGANVKQYSLEGENGVQVSVPVHDETWETEKPPKWGKGMGVFTFGNALSVHKSQGSTFKDVLFVDEDVSFFLNRQKFRYTACTRAAQNLMIAY